MSEATEHRHTSDETATCPAAPTRPRSAWVLVVIAAGFGAVLTGPYLLLDKGRSRIPVSSEAHFDVLVVHVVAACVALVLGAVQFLPSIGRGGRTHRRIGRVYLLAGVLPGAVSAVPVALWSGQVLTEVGLTVPAALWAVTGALAYRAARRRDVIGHRNWMLRNYALTLLAVTARVLVPVLLVARLALGTDAQALRHDVPSMIPVGQVLAWLINLAIAEVVIARRRH